MRLYELFTQWTTLEIIFFTVIYITEWLEVVTLGGLLLGSVLVALLAVLLDRLGEWLGKKCSPTCEVEEKTGSHSALPELVHKAVVLLGVLVGTQLTAAYLPGYTMKITAPLISFLLAFGLIAVYLGRLLRRQP